MITTGLDTRVNVQQLIDSQLPEYLLSESPNSIDFFKQYYASQEYQGGNIDIVDNLDQYLKLDNLTPERLNTGTALSADIGTTDTTINVVSTKGFPRSYGLFKVNDEIVTYTGITTNSFTGCIRGFCGITSYHAENNPGELVFSTSEAASATANTTVVNLSTLFLKEFYRKQKFVLTPGLEDTPFVEMANAGTFIKESKSLYQSKGTEESFRILFNVLYGLDPKIVDLEQLVLKPSAAEFIRREILVTERIIGDPRKLVGQTITLSSDPETKGAVSEVQLITTKGGATYYKISLFVGFNERDLIKGIFKIAGASKVIGDVGIGSSVITVDSTVGFTTSGKFISGINTITYTDKSLNQFLNCTWSGISSAITSADNVRSDEVAFGYENGDTSKKVELRITGVLNKFIPTNDIILRDEDEVVGIRNIGEEILNTSESNKEIFAHSWIYNTSSRFQIDDSYSASTKTTPILLSKVDKSQLRDNDTVEILVRGEKKPKATAKVDAVLSNQQDIVLTNLDPTSFSPIPNEFYDLRRSLETASSSGKQVGVGTWGIDNARVDMEYGNDLLVSDVQNIYVEETIEENNLYVASNSLPSYQIDVGIAKTSIAYADQFGVNKNAIEDLNVYTQKYTTIRFDTDVPFITGDEVVYTTNAATEIPGLVEGTSYYVKVLIDSLGRTNRIHLYASRSFILAPDNVPSKPTKVEFGLVPADPGYHSFTLKRYSKEKIGTQKLFKKFPIQPNIGSGEATKTLPGGVGILGNGVEVDSYKSYDMIYYGPLEGVTVFKGGRNYDVINPPAIRISQPPTYSLVQTGVVTTGAGVSATVRPVISGKIDKIQVDQQNFDIDSVQSITVKGGNGSGAILQPIVTQRFRELSFDARVKANALVGGVDIVQENIIFDATHNLEDGIRLVYDKNGNNPLGIGPYQGSNAQNVGINSTLQDGSTYWVKVVGISSVKLYPSATDYKSGINTVGFTTYNAAGTHKFRLYEGRNHLRSVKVIDSGSGYTNRKLNVYPVGISTVKDTINFKDHGFNQGEILTYATTGTVISGLVTTNQYKVIKLNDNEFRLANAGIGGTNTSDYDRDKYVKFEGKGTGVHSFAYPPIELVVDAKYAKVAVALTESLVVTPIVRGSIDQIYVYDGGTGYGSTVLNFEKTPDVIITNGILGELKPIISDGKIYSVDIQNQGTGYTAPPDIRVDGDGFGADLRAIIEDGKIVDVKVLNAGTGYTDLKTSLFLTSPGIEGSLISKVRGLSVNNFRFAEELDNQYKSSVLSESKNDLKYSYVGYSTDIGKIHFSDPDPVSGHSAIVGWAYDGNPIYGPYGYSDPMDNNSSIIILRPGYNRNTWSRNESTGVVVGVVSDRPVGFSSGFFVEDFTYDGNGDLDEKNGRYCKTPEFPNGTYAYFVGVSTNPTSGKLEPKFPYFIGDSYRSIPVSDNLNQQDQYTIDFPNKSLARNTFPYKVSDPFSDNDFLVESNELVDQISVIDSISKGIVNTFEILESGSGYKVGQSATFDNTGTDGGGVSASIKRITGKDIFDINTISEKYEDVVFKWNSPNEVVGYISTSHTLFENDNITISGLSTSINSLSLQNHQIGISSDTTTLFKELGISVGGTVGVVTDIYVANIPSLVSVGSTIAIGSEKLSVLSLFKKRNILRVKRGESAGIHTLGTEVRTVPSFFSMAVKTPYFASRINDKVYFNAAQSIGVGTVVGIATTVANTIGESTDWISIASQSIHIPDHPFTHNQKVKFIIPTGANQVSISTINSAGVAGWNFGTSGGSVDAYVINKSKDYIGITTQLGICTSGVYFHNSGSNNSEYAFESDFSQVTGKVERIISTVAISTASASAHGMLNNDIVGLTVRSNSTVGIGTSTAVKLKFYDTDKQILVNSFTFGASGVSSATNTISETLHNLVTGQKVFYDGGSNQIFGLSTGSYYVYKVDDDKFKLGETRYDVVNDPPRIVNFTSTGGAGQALSLINPPIDIIRDNNLKFDLSDSSLQGYDFKLFYDSKFNNEYISTGQTSVSVTVGVGTIGVSTDASFTLNYSKNNPEKLYYSLSKAGFISTSDTDVANYSEITYKDSKYNGDYYISGVGATTFNISLRRYPESLFYSSNNTSLKYNTASINATGGIGSMSLAFGGIGYKTLPKFTGISSTSGKDANIVPKSNAANRIGEVRIIDPGFEYSSDPTLRPEALISPIINLKDSSTINSIEVLTGGTDYLSRPDLLVVDPETNIQVDNGFVEAVMEANAVTAVNIIDPPQGLTSLEQRIVAVNNNNGIQINNLAYNASNNRATITLQTPTLGFTSPPFAEGDKIFVEGLQQFIAPGSTAGDGFNSTDHGYKFFKVNSNTDGSALSSNPVKIAFQLNEYTTNPGIAKTSQSGYASVVKESNYPTFKSIQDLSNFQVGEKVAVFVNNTWISTDIIITKSESTSIKIGGKYRLKQDDRIKGETTGTIATINSLFENKGYFKVNYSLRKEEGWKDEIGKLSVDHQVLSNNDYYQNLSYSVQSPIEYEDLISPVNRLLHPAGMKNFADVGIKSSTKAGISTETENATIISQDLISEKRVDTVNIFDLAKDVDVQGTKSRFISVRNKKLSSYILCESNRVLEIDDISNDFSNALSISRSSNSVEIDPNYSRFLVQVKSPVTDDTQLTELTIFRENDDIFTLERGNLHNTTNELIEIKGVVETDTTSRISFIPADPLQDYDIKIYTSKFNATVGLGSTAPIGFVDLVGVTTNVGIGTSTQLVSIDKDKLDAYQAQFEITDLVNADKTIVDLYLTHDDTNVYRAEAYTDSQTQQGFSSNFIGTFHSNITGGILTLDYENTSTNSVNVRSKIVGFGTTAVGVGTHRFKDSGQAAGTEKSLRLESSFLNIGVSTGGTAFDNTTPGAYAGDSPSGISSTNITSFKSNIRVSIGETSAIHQILTIWDGTDVHTTNYPFVSIGTTTGIGTFKANVTNAIRLQFIPDAQWNGQSIDIQRYDEIVYSESDTANTAPDLTIGAITESLTLMQYNGTGNRLDKTDFELTHKGVPIFEKVFNPANANIVNTTTGLFTIQDHFFNTGERLIYTPNSSYTGVAGTAMETAPGTVLPTEVYAIRDTKDTFKLATSKANALAGTNVVFTSVGGGNKHELEMFKKLSKSIIQVSGLCQSPIAYSPLTTTLKNNVGNVSAASTIIGIAGLSSITPSDIFKIDDEYIKVEQVGIGTTSVGPITGIGTFNLLTVKRGILGSTAATHNNAATARQYKGSFNMVGSKIHFTDPPQGAGTNLKNLSNVSFPKASFDGRVYLRQDYRNNRVFDDVSHEFNGIGQTFRASVGGANTTGIVTGSTLVLINGIFQIPSTPINTDNNYSFIQTGSGVTGITSVSFTGITSENGSQIKSFTDVNQNQVPRGGMIVSLGSTGGLGISPLEGAVIRPVATNKTITGFIGIPTNGSNLSISTASYNNVSGELRVTTSQEHYFRFPNEFVNLSGLAFTCGGAYDVTGATYYETTGDLKLIIGSHNFKIGDKIKIKNNSLQFTCNTGGGNHTYPRAGTDPVAGIATPITGTSGTSITVNVGIGTTAIHTYNGGTATDAVTFGSQYVGVTTTIFPNAVNDRPFSIVGVHSPTEFTAQVGVSTIRHIYVGSGIASAYYSQMNWGSGYAGITTVSVYDEEYAHNFVSATSNAITIRPEGIGGISTFSPTFVSYASTTGDLILHKTGIGGTTGISTVLSFDRHNATTGTAYNATTGILTVRLTANPSPALVNGQLVSIDDNSLTFTCAEDSHATNHTYPRYKDPASKRWYQISNVASNIQFEIKVLDKTPSTNETDHRFVSAVTKGIKRSKNTVGIATGSLTFTCSRDNHRTNHAYPRTTDPAAGLATAILGATENSITVNVRPGGGAGTGAVITGVTTNNTHRYNGGTATNAIFQNTWGNNAKNVTNATYDPATGQLVLTSANHGYSGSNTVGIDTGKIIFTCARDNFTTDHGYPRAGYAHSFSSSASTLTNAIVSGGAWNGTGHTPTDASYNPTTGLLVLTKATHGLTTSDTVGIRTGSLAFKCSKDNYATDHTYPRVTDPINGLANVAIAETTTNTITIQVGRSLTGADPMSGISTIPIASVTTNTITLNVGKAPEHTGGSLLFNVTAAGSGYVNPAIAVSPPSYSNLEVEGVSRVSVGTTTELGQGVLVTVDVGSGSTVGVGSTLIGVESFKIPRSGFGYEVGDVFKPVGLVTDYRIPKLTDLELTVEEIFTDRFSSWDFGEFDYIDSIYSLQNGTRTRFPLNYNGSLVSFEKDPANTQSALIDLNSLLLIFCNGVLQNPGESYFFNGGTSIEFAIPPDDTDDIAIFFYRGTTGVDSRLITIKQSLKKGDILQIRKDNTLTTKPTQNPRTAVNIFTSDILETDIYSQQGIDDQVYKPMSWTRQKVDKVINGEIVYKNRDLYEPLIYPTARIIADVSTTDTTIFVDNADFFKEDISGSIPSGLNGLIVPSVNIVPAELTATVSAAGTVNPLTIVNGGSGYVGSTTSVVIGIPTTGIGVGIGTTATATATITSGSISAVTIVNPGWGYTNRTGLAPQVIAPTPVLVDEEVTNIGVVQGLSGIITGITTMNPSSTKLGLEFNLRIASGTFGNLSVGDPIYIYDTAIGSGSTSLWNNSNNNVVGIGTTFIDNVYRIRTINAVGTGATITCFVHTGLTTTTLGNKGDRAPGIITGRDYELGGVGKFSWGKLSSLSRGDSPISIGVTGSTVGLTTQIGITTFPTIQRRGIGLDDTGALDI